MKPVNDFSQIKKKYIHSDFKVRKINDFPYILKMNKLLNSEEVEEILKLAQGKFEKSNVVVDGELIYNDSQRNSSTAYIFEDGIPDKYNKTLERFIRRICHLVQCKRSQLEIMCVRYRQGEQFGQHVDYFQEEELNVLDDGGQRIGTFFVYLNTLSKEDGGETEFTQLGLKSRPKRGDALFWWNQMDGEMVSETEHRGNPVVTDTIKYGMNIFCRDRPFY